MAFGFRRCAGLLLAVFAASTPAFAQTSWGLAVTPAGDIVFCDLRRNRVATATADGDVTELRPDTYCRNLTLGPGGFVYGESASLPAIDGTVSNRQEPLLGVWRAGLAGRTAWAYPPAATPEPANWIVVDERGRSYGWNGSLPRTLLSQLVRRDAGGVTVLAGGAWGLRDGVGLDAQFGRVTGLALAGDGSLVVADSGRIRRVTSDGRVTTESVGNFSDVESGVVGPSGLWGREVGVATDGDGSAIVVDTPARRIVRVARDGSARELWRSTGGWRPTGVAMAASGFYVVEDWAVPAIIADVVGVPRVLFVNPDGSSRTVASASSLLVRGMALLSVLIVLSALHNWRRRLGASRWQAARPRESGLK